MQIAFIPTVHTLETDNTDYHMALTHLILKYPHYKEYYSNISGYIILDNSLIELGGSVDIETVIEAAEMINPNEIVLPDVFLDCAATLKITEKTLNRLDKLGVSVEYKLQAVAHGKSKDDWQYCWNELSKIDEIDCISIPKVTTTVFGHRGDAIKYALKHNLLDKEIHLLGLWDTITELKSYTPKQKKAIRGIDTSFVIHSAISGMSYLRNEFDKPDYKIDLEHEYKFDSMKLVEENKKFVLDILK